MGCRRRTYPGRSARWSKRLQTVPLLARALSGAGLAAPVTIALAGLIDGRLPLEEWVSVVRTTVPAAPGAPTPARRVLAATLCADSRLVHA